jgi:hypothetical protein
MVRQGRATAKHRRRPRKSAHQTPPSAPQGAPSPSISSTPNTPPSPSPLQPLFLPHFARLLRPLASLKTGYLITAFSPRPNTQTPTYCCHAMYYVLIYSLLP